MVRLARLCRYLSSKFNTKLCDCAGPREIWELNADFQNVPNLLRELNACEVRRLNRLNSTV